jgi:hypothetical protein
VGSGAEPEAFRRFLRPARPRRELRAGGAGRAATSVGNAGQGAGEDQAVDVSGGLGRKQRTGTGHQQAGEAHPARAADQLAVLSVAATACTWAAGFRPVLDLGAG